MEQLIDPASHYTISVCATYSLVLNKLLYILTSYKGAVRWSKSFFWCLNLFWPANGVQTVYLMKIEHNSWNVACKKNDDNSKEDQSLAIVLVQLLSMGSCRSWSHHLKCKQTKLVNSCWAWAAAAAGPIIWNVNKQNWLCPFISLNVWEHLKILVFKGVHLGQFSHFGRKMDMF